MSGTTSDTATITDASLNNGEVTNQFISSSSIEPGVTITTDTHLNINATADNFHIVQQEDSSSNFFGTMFDGSSVSTANLNHITNVGQTTETGNGPEVKISGHSTTALPSGTFNAVTHILPIAGSDNIITHVNSNAV